MDTHFRGSLTRLEGSFMVLGIEPSLPMFKGRLYSLSCVSGPAV